MEAKVLSTGKFIKNVEVFKKDADGKVLLYIDNATNTVYKAEDIEEVELLKEEDVFDFYQERSITAGDRAEHLAWLFVIMLCALLIGKSRYYEFYVLAAGGIGYIMLSSLQALYQTFTSWLLHRLITRGALYDDYPKWVGCGAWAFFWAKMLVITATSIYGISNFMQLL